MNFLIWNRCNCLVSSWLLMGHSYWFLQGLLAGRSFFSGEFHRCSLQHQGHWLHNLQACQPLYKVEGHLHESCACPFLCLESSVHHSWPIKWCQWYIVVTVYCLQNNKRKKSSQAWWHMLSSALRKLRQNCQRISSSRPPSATKGIQGQSGLHQNLLQTNKTNHHLIGHGQGFKSFYLHLIELWLWKPEEMEETPGPSFCCCVVPNFFQVIHLVSACLLGGEICLGPLLSSQRSLHLLWEMGSDSLGPGAQASESTTCRSGGGGAWCPNCFLDSKWQRSRKTPPACLFSFRILKWSTTHAEKT